MFSRLSIFAVVICAFAQTDARLGVEEISQVIQGFDQFPPQAQELWLDQKWNQVSDERWLPLLHKLAARELTFRQGPPPDFDPVAVVTKLALKRWYELDPQTGREAILREILSPLPRFGQDVLGILPDTTLLVEQHVIAKNFSLQGRPAPIVPTVANKYQYLHRYDAMAAQQVYETNLASLLFRYADRDALPEVLPIIQSRLAERNCSAQYNEIAFLLKINASEADSVMRAVASDRPPHAGCVLELYSKIAPLVKSAVLERFAIESLNDQDLLVATEALRYLRQYGSARAEKPIFDRLITWNAKWRGRASELSPAYGSANSETTMETIASDPNLLERSFGLELVQTLVRGREWRADEPRLHQIISLALEPDAIAQASAMFNSSAR